MNLTHVGFSDGNSETESGIQIRVNISESNDRRVELRAREIPIVMQHWQRRSSVVNHSRCSIGPKNTTVSSFPNKHREAKCAERPSGSLRPRLALQELTAADVHEHSWARSSWYISAFTAPLRCLWWFSIIVHRMKFWKSWIMLYIKIFW